jgi:hypothetical protein
MLRGEKEFEEVIGGLHRGIGMRKSPYYDRKVR